MPTEAPQPVHAFDAFMLQYGPLIFGGVLLLMGLCGLGIGVWALYEAVRGWVKVRSAHRWPAVPGVIIDSAISYRPRTIEGGGTVEEWAPYIRYRYTVGDREYVSDKVIATSFESHHDQSYAEAWIAAYPLGHAVQVYYNPRYPGESIIEREAKASTSTIGERLGCGLFAMLFGLWALYTFWKQITGDG